MMKKLLKNFALTLALVASTFTFGQITVTWDNIPEKIDVEGVFSTTDLLVLTVDNIPNTNTEESLFASNIRVYSTGSLANVDKVLQIGLSLASGSPTVGNYYTYVDGVGTDADTFKRTFTISVLVQNTAGSGSGSYSEGSVYDFLLRVVDKGAGPNVDFTSTSTVTAVAAGTLSAKDFSLVNKSIYPNPVKNILTISADVKTERYKVVNVIGKTIKNVKANGTLDVSDLTNGVYILVTDVGIAKFIKQ